LKLASRTALSGVLVWVRHWNQPGLASREACQRLYTGVMSAPDGPEAKMPRLREL
jgi:hypothetical protein